MDAGALHWFTSDLRTGDNAALAEAGRAGPVAGVFVLNPAVLRRHAAAERRVAFMYATLHALDADLRGRGSRLVVVDGDPAVALPRLAARLGVRLVTHARNHEPAARARAARVARALERDGVTVRAAEAALVQVPGALRTSAGEAYRVYSAYARVWEAAEVPAASRAPRDWTAARALAGIGIDLPAVPDGLALPPAGEEAARTRLSAFLRTGVARYPETRDLPALDATSRLSPHLRWGALSGAEAVRRGAEGQGGMTALLLLAGVTLGSVAVLPFAAAAAIRVNLR